MGPIAAILRGETWYGGGGGLFESDSLSLCWLHFQQALCGIDGMITSPAPSEGSASIPSPAQGGWCQCDSESVGLKFLTVRFVTQQEAAGGKLKHAHEVRAQVIRLLGDSRCAWMRGAVAGDRQALMKQLAHKQGELPAGVMYNL